MNPNPPDPSAIDDQLAQIIAGTQVTSIQDVLDVMRRMDAVLPNNDGLKWFNFLYLQVTEAIQDTPPAEGWEDPEWLRRLVVCRLRLKTQYPLARTRFVDFAS
jgi:hypothetical protein